MQVTISLLPVSLSLVHIPRSRLNALSHPILRQILNPEPAFLNITCNEIELSIFAEHRLLQDFEPIARKDRQRQRSRSGSGSGKKGATRTSQTISEPVEISYDKWSVLQIDSHSDRIDSSGTRVYDLSAPLAAAGISILYQSSYMSDFIFVKEKRIREVMHLFAAAGFHLYSSDPNPSLSPSLSPISDDAVADLPSKSGAILTRHIDDTDVLNSTEEASSQDSYATGQQPLRNKSHSPTSGEVRILGPDLACVGLSDEFGVDHWGLKIVKLVAFPDLIPPSHGPASLKRSHVPISSLPTAGMFLNHSATNSDDTSSSSSDEDDGYFSHSPQNVSTSSLTTSSSRSYSDLPSLYDRPIVQTPSKHSFPPLSPMTPIQGANPPRSATSTRSLSLLTENSAGRSKSENHIPFLSFTRTPEGSSLTADVHVLATLFPPHERHMVICSGELDAADRRLDGLETSDEDEDEDRDSDLNGSLKCLQIDLRRFGLDKHGLVNRFSRVLEENGINHMYSSTFKTANLLVDKKDATRAQSLLRAC
ncbi:hypothetical protein CPB83DRAFT_754572 [Crepidotus variabilis]|uniref:CASTOR ACT domain-containing protein n=1 Tax=Crepidotus variabilis TaxID=179855 RepID=A0A9P6EU24_9AGAR|nr:hypothetical protein CPB83DRAFT_754572 [Crepidotus variabilis]